MHSQYQLACCDMKNVVVGGDGKSLNGEGERSTLSRTLYHLPVSNHDLEFLILDYW